MATYNFTDQWDTGLFTFDGTEYEFTQEHYAQAITLAAETPGENYNGETGYLYPSEEQGYNSSDLMGSFGSDFGTGGFDLVNYVDLDLNDDEVGEWQSVIDIFGDGAEDYTGAVAAAIDADGSGFIQVTSNFNGLNSFEANQPGSDQKLIDLWHIDGLSTGDYVTAQIISGTLTDANLHVWGEIDGYQPSAAGDQISWPYIEHDALAIDSSNMAGDHV